MVKVFEEKLAQRHAGREGMAGRLPVLELALDGDTAVGCPCRMAPLAWHSLLHGKLFRQRSLPTHLLLAKMRRILPQTNTGTG